MLICVCGITQGDMPTFSGFSELYRVLKANEETLRSQYVVADTSLVVQVLSHCDNLQPDSALIYAHMHAEGRFTDAVECVCDIPTVCAYDSGCALRRAQMTNLLSS